MTSESQKSLAVSRSKSRDTAIDQMYQPPYRHHHFVLQDCRNFKFVPYILEALRFESTKVMWNYKHGKQ